VLTGGYRRVPVLQIGADVYCDSALIARELERRFPEPTVYASCPIAQTFEDWADRRLVQQVMPSVVLAMLPTLPADILVDRAAMSPTMNKSVLERIAPHTFGQARLSLDRLDALLRATPFLLGDDFSLADAACHHPIWFLRNDPALFGEVDARLALAAWFERIAAFGAGDSTALRADDALAIARGATPAVDARGVIANAEGLRCGDAVSIVADDYGVETSCGAITALTGDESVIVRRDPSLGDVAVHFPRIGYRIVKT
jgi:glutathione S-transferase